MISRVGVKHADSDHNHLPRQLPTESMNGQYPQPAVVSGVAGYGAVLLLKMGHKPGVRPGSGEISRDWAELSRAHPHPASQQIY